MKTEKKCVVCKSPLAGRPNQTKICGNSCRKARRTELYSASYKCSQCGKDGMMMKNEVSTHCGKCYRCTRTGNGRLKMAILRELPIHRKLSEHHLCAVEGVFRDPRGVTHYFKNIVKFVTENSQLFAHEDLIVRPYGDSRASNGLRAVYNGTNGSWKGWTLVSDVEIKEGQWDLLRRKPITQEPK